MKAAEKKRLPRVGVDTGGTFTDFLVFEEGEVRTHKVLSTPADPSGAVLSGLVEAGVDGPKSVVHGSTVATNAILERKGARTALITTKGFEDVLEIGRQVRPEIYRLFVTLPKPLVDARHRYGLSERIRYDGSIDLTPDPRDLGRILEALRSEGIESVAICLLHSYANAAHEELAVATVNELGVPVSASHRILQEFREFERTSTTVVNAYVAPRMDRYLAELDARIGEGSLRIMQSNGGSISASSAKRESVRTILSGPAGGVVGAYEAAKAAGFTQAITFDMGGTSTDVALCDGGIRTTTEAAVAGLPVKIPMIDIHTVGAGGGSIARVDEGSALRVGPQSAGAEPGPACYGRGGNDVTVTDANLVLGRLLPDHFLGGKMALLPRLAEGPMRRLADRMKVPRRSAAEGVVRVANAAMERAIRVVSVEKGHDPRRFTLVCFGGAGPLHACGLAAALSIRSVLIPKNPGLLSAFGMLLSDVVKDYSRTHLRNTRTLQPGEVNGFFAPLEARAFREMEAEGVPARDVLLSRFVDMRYAGQSYEITVPYGERFEREFHRRHLQLYGYEDTNRETELVNVRIRAAGSVEKPAFPLRACDGEDPRAAFLGMRTLVEDGEERAAGVYRREDLAPCNVVAGPAVVVEYSSTVYVPTGWECRVDRRENLLLSPRGCGR